MQPLIWYSALATIQTTTRYQNYGHALELVTSKNWWGNLGLDMGITLWVLDIALPPLAQQGAHVKRRSPRSSKTSVARDKVEGDVS
jgi:hypothetical protein